MKMVNIHNGTFGGNVICKGCNRDLILSSDDNYTSCVRCRYPAELTYKKLGREIEIQTDTDSGSDMPWYGWILIALGFAFIITLFIIALDGNGSQFPR